NQLSYSAVPGSARTRGAIAEEHGNESKQLDSRTSLAAAAWRLAGDIGSAPKRCQAEGPFLRRTWKSGQAVPRCRGISSGALLTPFARPIRGAIAGEPDQREMPERGDVAALPQAHPTMTGRPALQAP